MYYMLFKFSAISISDLALSPPCFRSFFFTQMLDLIPMVSFFVDKCHFSFYFEFRSVFFEWKTILQRLALMQWITVISLPWDKKKDNHLSRRRHSIVHDLSHAGRAFGQRELAREYKKGRRRWNKWRKRQSVNFNLLICQFGLFWFSLLLLLLLLF